jgi:hypothetical protein
MLIKLRLILFFIEILKANVNVSYVKNSGRVKTVSFYSKTKQNKNNEP